MSMLKGLKVSFLARKCVFYRPKENKMQGGDFEGLEMQKRNILMVRTQRVDEKNKLICLVIFSPKFMVIMMSQMAHFLYFLLMKAKKQSQSEQDI